MLIPSCEAPVVVGVVVVVAVAGAGRGPGDFASAAASRGEISFCSGAAGVRELLAATGSGSAAAGWAGEAGVAPTLAIVLILLLASSLGTLRPLAEDLIPLPPRPRPDARPLFLLLGAALGRRGTTAGSGSCTIPV
jgi:hypothetical protein